LYIQNIKATMIPLRMATFPTSQIAPVEQCSAHHSVKAARFADPAFPVISARAARIKRKG
jgi:hypothetical protein